MEQFIDEHAVLGAHMQVSGVAGERDSTLPWLSEVFIHYAVRRGDTVLFSSGHCHFTIGRKTSRVPLCVRAAVRGYLSRPGDRIEMCCRAEDLEISLWKQVDPKSQVCVEILLRDVFESYGVTVDGLVRRRILREGSGKESPSTGSRVLILLSVYSTHGELVQETRELDFVFGESMSVLEVIEEAVAKMKKGELALITVPPEYSVLPTVSDLADAQERLFLIELVDFDLVRLPSSCSYLLPQFKSQWEFTLDDRIRFAAHCKEYGTLYFRSRLYERAINRYEQAVELLRFEDQSSDSMDAVTLKSSCLVNIGMCYMNRKDYFKAISYASESLALCPGKKALTLRIRAHLASWSPESALSDLKELETLPDANHTEVKMLQGKALQQLAAVRWKERQMFGGIYS